ncbi:hypothetical protein B0J12DRAFT_698038 [Macrophomina phaseolina]|uniref:Uncharacterized protein n=1 Tax=Macrophomina phaseolina TaxID=35725 RepID=A0ABQ8GFK3_9PEZI|nr:hypothetical protein B0J12DRAFT_698038 [Macrophomina phaseolina]
MSSIVSILCIGIDFDWTQANLGDKVDLSKIRAAVFNSFTELQKRPGMGCEMYTIVPDKKESFDEVTAKLRAGYDGKPWSGVSIGWGLRGNAKLTSLFETLVNTIKDETPQSRILFTSPEANQLESVERNFPHIQRPSDTA